MNNLLENLDYVFWGNEIGDYVLSFLVLISLLICLRIFRKIALKRVTSVIKKVSLGRSLISILESIKLPFYLFVSFWISLNVLNVDERISKVLNSVLIIWASYYLIIALQILIDYLLKKRIIKDPESKESFIMIGKAIKFVIWLTVFLMVISSLGINITSIVAGLGIGGIAIAFALQNVLSDLFSSFSIQFDKPFAAGDLILVGEHMGTVERIGIKTTRLRSIQGEEIIISNKELTTVRVQNFRKIERRRNAFKFGVVYETPNEKLKKIDEIIAEIIKDEELADFDRVFFIGFRDYSLEFEAVYFVLSGDYKEFLRTHESILLKIKERFEKEGIVMAFPTQTLYIKND